jgi:hypothetical protein
MTTLYAETTIRPHHAGFGMYDVDAANSPSDYSDDADILNEITDGTVYELGVDTLPDGVEDIRGKIYNEPTRVFALVLDADESVVYFGLIAKEFLEYTK